MHPQSLLAPALTILSLAPLSAAVLAQQPVRPRGEVRGPERVMQFVMSRRARLGLKVNLRARETDSVGAYVDAVTPNGPAAKAGIHSGDIITKLDGKSVLDGTEGDGARESLPGIRLIELAAELEPNDTVAVELRRGKETRNFSVVTTDEPTVMFRGRGARMAPPFPEAEFEGRFGGTAMFLYGSPLADVELAPLNPELGQYFGTTAGVLVISAPKGTELGLKGGDVVLSVDGRKPESPSHLLRILRSYEQGENFKTEILRNKKRETVVGRVGDRAN